MARSKGLILEIFDLFKILPWWISVVFAGIFYIALKDWFPSCQFEKSAILLKGFQPVAPLFAPWAAGFFLLAAAISVFNSWRKKQLLEKQSGIDSIRELHWKDFEYLVGEAFRRQGYSVIDNPNAGADGGIDLRLKQNGNLYLVQCKNWKVFKVGVKEIRELFGLVKAENATGGIFVTAGEYTKEAKSFADGKSLDLINGSQLQQMIQEVQISGRLQPEPDVLVVPSTPVCPTCGSAMILRTAKKGSNVGNQFYGCSKYPACKGTRPYA